jgi:hypothetical protein
MTASMGDISHEVNEYGQLKVTAAGQLFRIWEKDGQLRISADYGVIQITPDAANVLNLKVIK